MVIKVGVSDFWKPMLIFEITKTNTPRPQKCLAPILIAPPDTYVCQWLVVWNKAKPMLLTYGEETKQPRRWQQVFPLLEFSPVLESWSYIYTGHTSCLIITPCLHRTRQNAIELDAAPHHDKSPTINFCCVLFITYWHKFLTLALSHPV